MCLIGLTFINLNDISQRGWCSYVSLIKARTGSMVYVMSFLHKKAVCGCMCIHAYTESVETLAEQKNALNYQALY